MDATAEKAAEAWRLMTRTPIILDKITGACAMPPSVAIDMVEDTGVDRDDAVTALVHAAADWLDLQAVPDPMGTETDAGCCLDADLIRSYLRDESFGLALVHIVHIRDRCYRVTGYPTHESRREWMQDQAWSRWADKALVAVEHCRAVVAAAHPEPVA